MKKEETRIGDGAISQSGGCLWRQLLSIILAESHSLPQSKPYEAAEGRRNLRILRLKQRTFDSFPSAPFFHSAIERRKRTRE